MTQHSLQGKNRGKRRRITKGLAGALGLVVFGRSYDIIGKEQAVTYATMTLWQIVEALPRLIPFTKDKVETMLAVRLMETDYTGNDVFHFYRSDPIRLSDGVTVSNIDLRIRRKGGHPGFMVLSIDKACVTLDKVRGNYADLQITETPRGSPDDETSYSTMLPWGKLSFGFAERNPNCLVSIVFNPQKSQ